MRIEIKGKMGNSFWEERGGKKNKKKEKENSVEMTKTIKERAANTTELISVSSTL